MITPSFRYVLAAFVLVALTARADEPKPKLTGQRAPVAEIADQRIAVTTPEGTGVLPIYANHQINAAAPDVKQVLIIIHGTLRNADAYFASGEEAAQDGGEAGKNTLVVAPQFLALQDIQAFKPSSDLLAWTSSGWKGGEPARRPAPISSFAALDALLAHFANRALYPALTQVVLAGHSAGAQVVQRYAVVGQGEAILRQTGIPIRYVVANPSSYLYFDNNRPAPDGTFQAVDAATCPKAIKWKYGLSGVPPYVARQNVSTLEARYVARDVVYLLGMADTNPRTHFIDRSCAGMAQGPYRLARGLAYFSYLQRRHPSGLRQHVVEVPGVGHDDRGMFTSQCGLAVLFSKAIPSTCPHIP